MSRERQRRREERLAAQALERERWEKQRAKQQRVERLRPSAAQRPKRQKRYGALPLRVRLGLLFGWLVVQFVAWQLTTAAPVRVAVALVSLAALPLVVVLTLDPRRPK